MLAKRVIPCLDVDAGRVVKGVSFVNLRDAGDPVELAKFYDKQNADELIFLDITASHEGRNIMQEVAAKVAEQVFIPYTVGGGLRSVEDIRKMLSTGCDKVAINSAAVKNPQLIKEAAEKFGNQCIVVAIDAKLEDDGNYQVYINGGRIPTGLGAIEWAKKVEELGAGEIMLTSMDCDGTKDGYEIELTKKVTESVNIPVIASGGAGKLEHFSEVVEKADADAVLAASLFHFGELKIEEVKNYLKKKKIEVRK
ncbi:hypothetical protein LCGC14_1283180 [marine sediment metagenome]|uniref:imidazole glycerol-phosphate synthase n=1 Tax=marine sediment metagenome TaxID=412755 RepID=A0A0F9NXQ7_9ZZZZ|nr:imidazole glycerol phosphate synthase subunit HisF [Actinomycetota bacterium]